MAWSHRIKFKATDGLQWWNSAPDAPLDGDTRTDSASLSQHQTRPNWPWETACA